MSMVLAGLVGAVLGGALVHWISFDLGHVSGHRAGWEQGYEAGWDAGLDHVDPEGIRR